MIDDPLSLLSLAVWLMAAGMWPVGFLFGACSACCDECPPECNKCSQAYESIESGPCSEPPDSLVATSDYASKSYTADEDGFFSTIGIQHLQLTDVFPCTNPPNNVTNLELYFALKLRFISLVGGTDGCGCNTCEYNISCELNVAERYIFGGQSVDVLPDSGAAFVELLEITFAYDKCAMATKRIEITVTPAQIIKLFVDSGGENAEGPCPGITAFVNDIEEFVFTLDYNLDDPCECGACCRNGLCTENELQTYCEQNSVWFGELEDGTWQGVGTSCDDDPDPCAEE
jgi:hypothetical protein